jgi:hypothetical protein
MYVRVAASGHSERQTAPTAGGCWQDVWSGLGRGGRQKPVAVFRSGVIGDSRHTSDSIQTAIWCYFPLSAGISPRGQYQPHGQWGHLVDATGRDQVYGWLSVGRTVLVGSRGRVGLVTPTPNGHLPAPFGGPFHLQLGEWRFSTND